MPRSYVRKKANIHPTKGKGVTAAWLRAHVSFDGNGCLEWPFSRSRGYGHLKYGNKIMKAHRQICILAHGKPPTPKHEAAHSCGNHGCVNRNHISWKTRRKNQAQSVAMGRFYRNGRGGTLNRADATEIRALKGQLSQDKIAAKFNVTHSTIAKIHRGEIWK